MSLRDSIIKYNRNERIKAKWEDLKNRFKHIFIGSNPEERYEEILQRDIASIALITDSIEYATILGHANERGALINGMRLSDSYFTKLLVNNENIISTDSNIYDSTFHRKYETIKVNLRTINYNNGETKRIVTKIID